jgi:hypothetical protein
VGQGSCESTPTEFMVWPPPCNGWDEAHDVSAESYIVKMVGSVRENAESRAPLACEGSWLSTELLDRVLDPRVGLLFVEGHQ